jgi:hypothetical protein
MWNKIERFVLVTGIYDNLLEPTYYTDNDINWDFIIDNCLYQKETVDKEKINFRYNIFLNNKVLYLDKIKTYLQNFDMTPQIVIAILITFFIEVDEAIASNEILKGNFLGKYPRLTQELIAGEYTSLINAIVRKVSNDQNLNFAPDSESQEEEV